MTDKKRYQESIDLHRQRIGWVQPHNHTLAEVLPEVVDAKSLLYSALLGQEKYLPLKTKALIHLALSAARFAQGTPQHAKNAMKHGATREEMVEAVSLNLVTFGGQAVRWGIDAIDKVFGQEYTVDESGLK